MKAKPFFQATIIALFFALGVISCKKDNKTEPEPVPTETVNLTIEDLRKKSTATSVTIAEQHKTFKVKGIVVSDKDGKNIDAKTMVLQQANEKPAIIVNFAAAHSFAIGDEVQLDIDNQKLEQVNGEIVLNAIPVDKAVKTGTGTITARTTSIAEIKTNKTAWDGTLVTITATDLSSGSGKYSGSLTVKDASGDLTSLVHSGATFENTELPPSVSKLTGIVRINGNDVRIDLRNTTEVVTGSVTSSESFEPDQIFRVFGGSIRSVRALAAVGSDVSFTDAAKVYGYLMRVNTVDQIKNITNNPAGLYNISGTLKANAKEVTIRFAGSSLQGTIAADAFTNDGIPFTLNAFNAAQHNVKIGVGLLGRRDNPLSGTNLIGESASYNETGKFFEFKLKLPTTSAELQALGFTASNEITAWLASPKIVIYNLSTKRSTGSANDEEALGYAPVLLSTVKVGY